MSSFSASARRAMATAYGSLLAQDMAQDTLPVPHDPAPGLPPSPIKEAGVYLTTQYYRILDRFI
ncbi:hypothetical protein [Paenirhodobacter populi]|uniref:Uncharacterized protein n=1 Tax=Paenirhodobacter populi TaxID=2306993 RepID=A0A443ITG4_9RHOB|nr:hypothetical protein [Sinirhodobacter populi]RWR10988.1 hypothetical protein D2T33_11670 [Sinirhodobacter populi]